MICICTNWSSMRQAVRFTNYRWRTSITLSGKGIFRRKIRSAAPEDGFRKIIQNFAVGAGRADTLTLKK